MRHRHARGFSMVELLIALTIGLLLLGGLTMIFVNSSEASRELQKTAQQVENGRYAIDILTRDLQHAGFYGHLHELPPVPASADPCETGSAANLFAALPLAVQGYTAPDLSTVADVSATTCDDIGLLTTSNMSPGSDVLVVRRTSTERLAPTDVAVTNEAYLQATGTQGEVQFGNGAAIGNNKANGSASTLFFKDGVTAAPIRKLDVHVYFVAPCSIGSGTNGVCTASDDSIPTLKRLALESVGGTLKMQIVPLVEGIEYFKIEYGVDTQPTAVNAATGLSGDATADSFVATPADWSQAIAAEVYILARNTLPTPHHTDDKSYTLGATTVAAANDHFKRHVYTAAVSIMNAAGRREIP